MDKAAPPKCDICHRAWVVDEMKWEFLVGKEDRYLLCPECHWDIEDAINEKIEEIDNVMRRRRRG